MISSVTSILVVVTSTICEAFQQIPQQQRSTMMPYVSPAILRGMKGYNNNIRSNANARDSIDVFQRNNITPQALSVMKQSENPVHDRRRFRRRRYMIGDVVASKLGGDHCRKICCLPTALYTSSISSSSSSSSSNNNKGTTTQLYCSAINPDDIAIDDREMKTSEVVSKSTTATSWKEKLLQFSTIASILCVVDCTILPILTIILPLLGMVSAVNTMLPFNHLLHHSGHLMTIYFVLPIGFFATTTNYLYNHRQKWITAIGWFGLLLILAANSGTGGCGSIAADHVHTHAHHAVHTAATHVSLPLWDGFLQLVLSVRNTIQHGIYHRITNLSGCAFLIVSNYISHQYQKNHRTTKSHVHGKDCCAPTPRPSTTSI